MDKIIAFRLSSGKWEVFYTVGAGTRYPIVNGQRTFRSSERALTYVRQLAKLHPNAVVESGIPLEQDSTQTSDQG